MNQNFQMDRLQVLLNNVFENFHDPQIIRNSWEDFFSNYDNLINNML